MIGVRCVGACRGVVVAIVAVCLSAGVAWADSDCWCAQFVDLEDEIPTRNTSVFLRIAASAALTGLTWWGVDAIGLPNAQWYKISGLVVGISNAASALADLALPTDRAIARDAERIARSTLSEDLCADTLAGYAETTRTHRYITGLVDVGSGMTQILLLSPYGRYASGEIYDYVFLVTGGIDIVAGLIDLLFPTRFERAYREARETCGP